MLNYMAISLRYGFSLVAGIRNIKRVVILSKTSIIILCAGEAERWNNYLGIPKQLITIGGETLLERTVRLCRAKNNYDIHIVSNNDLLRTETCNYFEPSKHQWIVETLLSTQSLWNEKTIILLGDVFFTQKAIHTILKSDENFHFYGRFGASKYTSTTWGEIFALSFSRYEWPNLITNAQQVCLQAKSGGRGKLWELYRSLAGFLPEEHKVENNIFISIHDFTDDFDSPIEYKANIRRYEYLTSKSRYKNLLVLLWVNYVYSIRIVKSGFRLFMRCFADKS